MSFLTPTGITSVYSNLEALESKLNILGYIPFVGTISSTWGRYTLATAQAVAGVALGVFYVLFTVGNPLASFYGTVAVCMLKHALLNGIRASFEVKPFVPLIVLLPLDILCGRMFPYPL